MANEIVKADEPGNMLQAILGMVKDPAIDASKLAAMLAMQERLEEREAAREFNRAYAAMEPNLPKISKDGTVNDKSGKKMFSFASWEKILEIIKPILRVHGFTLNFTSTQRQGEGGGLIISGTLRHVDGHSIEASIPLPLDASGGKNATQGAGSTSSYGRRYCTTMLLNLSIGGEDDDGVEAGRRYITAAQLEELEALIEEKQVPRDRFVREYAGLDDLADMEEKNFNAARTALRNRKAPQ